jgi:hypothetical protein
MASELLMPGGDPSCLVTPDGKPMSVEEREEAARRKWEKEVLHQHQNHCANCGGTDRLKVHMVVPLEAGGKLELPNGTVLCRTCEMAKDAVEREARGSERRPVNFWVSRKLYTRIDEALRTRNGFVSVGSLVRYLMMKYVTDPERFDDIERYQDFGAAEVKLNVWVDADTYETFRELLSQQRMTVTDALKALIQLYDEETVILDTSHKPLDARLHDE